MTAASGLSTVKSKNTMKAGLAVETMSAPNPFCPNTKVNNSVSGDNSIHCLHYCSGCVLSDGVDQPLHHPHLHWLHHRPPAD